MKKKQTESEEIIKEEQQTEPVKPKVVPVKPFNPNVVPFKPDDPEIIPIEVKPYDPSEMWEPVKYMLKWVGKLLNKKVQ